MEDDLDVDPGYESLELGGSLSGTLPHQLSKAFRFVVGEQEGSTLFFLVVGEVLVLVFLEELEETKIYITLLSQAAKKFEKC